MGKIKSAIITAILVAAIVVLAFFATVSYTVPGSNGVKRYNSFLSNINLGGDFTGEAYAVLYPEGVCSAAYYSFNFPDDEDKQQDYADKYVQHGSVYVEKEVIEKYDGEDGLKETVKSDAEVLSARLGQKGYSSYSVSVQDDYTLKVAVPTNFTYAEYKQYDATGRSEKTALISQSVQYLSYSGELSLRNSEVGKDKENNILTLSSADITTYFKSVKKYSAGGNYAVKLNLTKAGREEFKRISAKVAAASEDTAIGFYVGENQLLSLNVSEAIDAGSFYISIENGGSSTAQDYAIVLNSVANGNNLTLNYNYDDEFEIVYASAAFGNLSVIFLACAALLIIIAAIIFSVVRYKKLGIVNALMILIYALAIVTAAMLLNIQFTIAVAIFAVLGLALLCGCNFALFEEVRKETKKGKTMQSAVKSAYKNLLTGILELHIILVVVSIMLALICVGELAACGFVIFIASVASYVLYWFTRFIWYVMSSPVRDKFRFGGFTREEYNGD